jgi:hypothetical protein
VNPSELEEAVFRAPPKRFTAARDALAAALKQSGKKDEARTVKAWRRPPLAVWLLNRLVLDGAGSATEVLRAADALARDLAGGKPGGQHIAGLRAAGAKLAADAAKLAAKNEVGFSSAQERELIELVQALPWREQAREEAARGRLLEMPPPVDPLEAMRLGAGAPPLPPTPPKEDETQTSRAEAEAALAEAQAALAEAQAALAEAQSALAAAEEALAEAERRVRKTAAEEEARARDVAAAEKRLHDLHRA